MADFIKRHYGIHLGNSKQVLVVGRLRQVLLQEQFKSFSDYYEHLTQDESGHALRTLLNRITTNYTFFMRETQHFDYLREKLLPILTHTVKNKDLRIWSAGCSSGEEPYSIAMLLADYFGSGKMLWDTKILATDISSQALETAAQGEYAEEQLVALPDAWRRKYFHRLPGSKFVLKQEIREEVIFRHFNLMEPAFPFKQKFHAIFCRNVMIYFDEKTKYELVDKFCSMLEHGGCLFIGHSESLDRKRVDLRNVMPAVYRKE